MDGYGLEWTGMDWRLSLSSLLCCFAELGYMYDGTLGTCEIRRAISAQTLAETSQTIGTLMITVVRHTEVIPSVTFVEAKPQYYVPIRTTQ